MFGLMCVCIELILFSFNGITLTKWNDYIFYAVGSISATLEAFVLCSFSQILTDSVSKIIVNNDGVDYIKVSVNLFADV